MFAGESFPHQETQLEANRLAARQRLYQYSQTPREVFLREHQTDVIGSLEKFLAGGGDAGYISLPTGSGKTVLIAEIVQSLGMKTLILSPTQQILEQTQATIETFAPGADITKYYGRGRDLSGNVINATYQSLPRLIKEGRADPSRDPSAFELVICDEAHTALGEKRHTCFREFNNAIFLGLTATPYFTPLEGFIKRGIVSPSERWTGLFKNLIHEMTLEEAIEREVLSNLDVFLVKTSTTVENVRLTVSGEYDRVEIERYLNTQVRNYLTLGMVAGVEVIPPSVRITDEQREMINEIHKKIQGKRTVIFGLSINHVEELAKKVKEAGIRAAAVHGKTDPNERQEVLAAHTRGETPVVLGVDMLRLGWDSPATEVGIYLAPTRSGIVAVQELGRILRLSAGTGKERAIAVQLVDQYQVSEQAPVLIPNIFDPYYVLRGTQLGKEKGKGLKGEEKPEPQITFHGMNVGIIIEEAQSGELLHNRFKQASVQEINRIVEGIVQKTRGENPRASLYNLYRAVAESLPQRLPSEVQQVALQAIASIDSNTAREGERALVYLNLRTIFSAIEPYLSEGEEEEVFQAAMVAVTEKMRALNPGYYVSLQLYQAAQRGAARCVAYSKEMPSSWALDPQVYQKINEVMAGEFLPGRKIPLSAQEIDDLAQRISTETGIDFEKIRDYLIYQNSLKSLESGDEDLATEEDTTVLETAQHILRDEVENVLSGLGDRQQGWVIADRYFRNQTQGEVGRKMALSSSAVGQREKKALHDLRHPSRSKKIKWGLHLEETINIREPEEKVVAREVKKEASFSPFDLEHFVYRGQRPFLRLSGIREIGDFFSAKPQEILEEWEGHPEDLRQILLGIIYHQWMRDLYYDRRHSEGSLSLSQAKFLLSHLSEAVIYKDRKKAMESLSSLEIMVIEESQGLLNEDRYTQEEREAFQQIPISKKNWLQEEARRKIFVKAYKELSDFVHSGF